MRGRPLSLSVEQELKLTADYIARRPTKVIAYEFGVSSQNVTRIAVRHGAPYRTRNHVRNVLAGREATVLALFRQGLDSCSIAHRLSVKEHIVSNALARLRDGERRQ